MRILLVEDDVELARLITDGLRQAGFGVDEVSTLADADVALTVNRYDCVVADRGLPDGDAVELVASLRAAGIAVPVLLLTAMGAVEERVAGFEHGADDYLVKPFAFPELVVRVRALGRRQQTPRAAVAQLGDLVIDLPRRRVTRSGVLLMLTAKEFSVLDVLAARVDEVVSRSELIEHCWDEVTEPMSNAVDVLIGQLRRKLGAPPLIETVRGAGYRLAVLS